MAKQTSAEFRALVADAMTHFQAGRLGGGRERLSGGAGHRPG